LHPDLPLIGLVYPKVVCYLVVGGAQVAEDVLTVRDVARHLNVDEKTVYRLTQRGSLPGFKVAGTWRFKRSDLEAWIELQKEAAANQPPRGDE
jgi:excisionase family DNA binding protein